MSLNQKVEEKEPNKEEIQNILKKNIITIFNQIKNGCKNKICYNIYCSNNLICKTSKQFYIFKLFLPFFNYNRIYFNSKW
jgi:hypothetical protein